MRHFARNRAKLGIEEACRDSWNWISNNPNGYNTTADATTTTTTKDPVASGERLALFKSKPLWKHIVGSVPLLGRLVNKPVFVQVGK